MPLRSIRVALFSLALVGLFLGRSAGAPEQPGMENSPVVEQIAVQTGEEAITVTLDPGRRTTYFLSTSLAPPRVSLQLEGAVGSGTLEPIQVGTAPLLEVVPTEGSKGHGSLRVDFLLTTLVKPDIRREESRLLIVFPRGGGVADDADESTRGIKPTSDSEKPKDDRSIANPELARRLAPRPAQILEQVTVEKEATAVSIDLRGDGWFRYTVIPVDPSRIAIDLAQVKPRLKVRTLPVNHALLTRIRIGRHPDKTRVVLDVPQPVEHEIQTHARRLHIQLTPSDAAVTDATKQPSRDRPTDPRGHPQAMSRTISTVSTGENPGPPYGGRRISMDFQDADITNVFRLIADVSGLNIVVGETVTARVTMKLRHVPWDQALDMLLKMNHLGMVQAGNIVWIDTLANIARQQDEEAKAKESQVKATDLITRVVYIQNVPAKELEATLRNYLSPRGQLNVNEAANAMIVEDTPRSVAEFEQLVQKLDKQEPQIQIEARIVQTNSEFARSLGIQWGLTSRNTLADGRVANFVSGPTSQGVTRPFGQLTPEDFLVNLPAQPGQVIASPLSTMGFVFGNLMGDGNLLDLRLSAGEALGLTKVISAPKIITLNNREAKIEQGDSIPFQTTSLQGTQTTFVDALLTLQVTPQITSRDPDVKHKQILLKIKATRNAPGDQLTQAGPNITRREASTQILVKDGGTTVIGGIFEDELRNRVEGFPYLSRIPVLGWLFKSKRDENFKRELLIFITPSIVKTS